MQDDKKQENGYPLENQDDNDMNSDFQNNKYDEDDDYDDDDDLDIDYLISSLYQGEEFDESNIKKTNSQPNLNTQNLNTKDDALQTSSQINQTSQQSNLDYDWDFPAVQTNNNKQNINSNIGNENQFRIDNNNYNASSNIMNDTKNNEETNLKTPINNISSILSSSSKRSNALKITALVCILSAVIYFIFKPSESELIKNQKEKETEIKDIPVVKPPVIPDSSILSPKIPVLPEPPKIIEPTPPPPAPVAAKPTEIPSLPAIKHDIVNNSAPLTNTDVKQIAPVSEPAHALPAINNATREAKLARMKSAMNLKSGVAFNNTKLIDSGDVNYSQIPMTSTRVTPTKIGNLDSVIAQGYMLDAVLETAINTDYQGFARAIISRKAYSESGTNILIPEGSRLIGKYTSSVSYGNSRIEINWVRLIRPDGVDIALNSPSTDPLGNTGSQGEVNNKYAQMFANSLMLSILNMGVGKWQDTEGVKTTTNNNSASGTPTYQGSNANGDRNIMYNGCSYVCLASTSTTQQGATIGPYSNCFVNGNCSTSNTNQSSNYLNAVQQLGTNLGNVGSNILNKETSGLKPTITIPQGTAIKVFVANDLYLPKLISHDTTLLR